MAKRRKVIKRVYEEGRETTVPSSKAKGASLKKSRISKILDKIKSGKPAAGRKPLPVKSTPSAKYSKPAPEIIKPKAAVEKTKQAAVDVFAAHIKNRVDWQPDNIRRIEVTAQDIRPSDKPFIEKNDIPVSYGATRLTLIAKDPFWIYAYWDITEHSINEFKRNHRHLDINSAKTVLRLYDISLIDFNGFNANHFFDIEVGPFANNWYINLWCDGASYVGEIGLHFPDGYFAPLARSNYVQTPRISFSPRTEQIWMRVTDSKASLPFIEATMEISDNAHQDAHEAYHQASYQAAHYKKTRKGRKSKASSSLPAKSEAVRRVRRTIYISEEDIRQFYAALSPILKHIVRHNLKRSFHDVIAKIGGREKYEFFLEGMTYEERRRILTRLPAAHFIRRIRTGSSAEIILIGGASESLVSSERLAKAPSSDSNLMQARLKTRKFFFEIGAELIVYGRTEPDAEVWLGDKEVKLRSDGTFGMRYALPDGMVPFEFTAISGDKEEYRKINTYVERKTFYPSVEQ